jgi:8-oxo-dGTP pyrophosphatase MutT (NUDIX family)
MYCNNCGEKGHAFRDCGHPIMSCGIILLDSSKLPCDPRTVKVLMVRRKHSMAFTEFVRGKYEPRNLIFIKKLLANMTFDEHKLLKTLEFSDIWTQHWGVGRDHHSHEYELSKARFEGLDINSLIGTEGYPESEWGFPKGRRQQREADLNCAIREFSEETDISRDLYTVCKNLLFEETFKGTNDIEYKHVYFLSITTGEIKLNTILSHEQEREICEMRWMTLAECALTTRQHLLQRPKLLENLEKTITLFNT